MTTYDIIAINAKQPHVRAKAQALKAFFLSNNAHVYALTEDYLRGPGMTGSPQFDAAMVADIILKEATRVASQDADAAIVAALKHVEIWKMVPDMLRGIGFVVERGKITGVRELLTDKSGDDSAAN